MEQKLDEKEAFKKEKNRKKFDKATSNDPAPNVNLVVEPNIRVKDALTGHVLNVSLKSLIRKVNFIVRKNLNNRI